MSKQRVTIKDIANELKISVSTVSRALTDRWDVNPETRKAVMELAERWNYHPNPISLNLKRQQSMLIGVIIPEFINSFFPEIIIGFESVLYPHKYQIVICQSNESSEKELLNLKMLESNMVDGFLISITKETKNIDYFNHLIDNGFPLVFFNRCPDVSASSVVIDDYKWAFLAVEHLIHQGYKRIVHLSGQENLDVSIQRQKGYMDALKKHSLPLDESLIIPCGILMEQGIISAHKILEMKELPDAIFAVNDPTAIGAMKTLQKHGIKIPEDIAVVGFTESQIALIVEPNLTTVEQPTFEIGKVAAELLLEQIKHNNEVKKNVKKIVLEAKLNIRESSCRQKQQILNED